MTRPPLIPLLRVKKGPSLISLHRERNYARLKNDVIVSTRFKSPPKQGEMSRPPLIPLLRGKNQVWNKNIMYCFDPF